MHKIKKICLVGNSAAGKSTLSKKISEKTGIEMLSIDKFYWLPGWILREQCSFSKMHQEWLAKDAWIIDGIGYWDELLKSLEPGKVKVINSTEAH